MEDMDDEWDADSEIDLRHKDSYCKSLTENLLHEITDLSVKWSLELCNHYDDDFEDVSMMSLSCFWNSASALPSLKLLAIEGFEGPSLFSAFVRALVPVFAAGELADGTARPVDPFPALRKLELRNLVMNEELQLDGRTAFEHLNRLQGV